jgi:conjugal transfer/entry exclusion protein
MSIQDEIFDLEDFLENTDATEKDRFDRIIRYLGELEKEVDEYRKLKYHMHEIETMLKNFERVRDEH